MGKVKIIASIGPSSSDIHVLLRMAREGVDGFRLNFSHGTHEEKKREISLIREVESRLGKPIPIIGDLSGPSIRIGEVPVYEVKRGQKLKIIPALKGDRNTIPLPSIDVFNALEEEDILLLSDGKIALRVEEVTLNHISAIALNDGVIKSRASIVVKGKEFHTSALTEKDLKDIEFCINNDIEYIALSYVRSADDVRALKDILGEKGREDIRVIAKIETKSAVSNLDQIVEEADVILIARGDLGMHFPLEEIPKLQKEITMKSLSRGKPVIVATQLLESVVYNPTPTRSEIVDVMTAVCDGVDALLLTDETTVGKYPIEAVRWLKRIIEAYEDRSCVKIPGVNETIYDKFAKGITLLAESMNAKIIAYTRSGNTARRLSRYRPATPLIAVASNIKVARQISILWGVKAYSKKVDNLGNIWDTIRDFLKQKGEIAYGDIVIMTIGLRKGTTDLVRIEMI
ncbi:MAG TPA: pyruvate kinase [Desulfurococcales archaeon]|nr:pyruvate kinase [Desulfurococcales archaeon]